MRDSDTLQDKLDDYDMYFRARRAAWFAGCYPAQAAEVHLDPVRKIVFVTMCRRLGSLSAVRDYWLLSHDKRAAAQALEEIGWTTKFVFIDEKEEVVGRFDSQHCMVMRAKDFNVVYPKNSANADKLTPRPQPAGEAP